MNSRVEKKLRYIPFPDSFEGKSILDLGCNDKGFSKIAEERGAGVVKTVDVNPYYRPDYVKDIEDIREIGVWDVVLCMAILHHVPNIDNVLKIIKTLIQRPSGYVFFEIAINPDNVYAMHKRWGEKREQAWYWEPDKGTMLVKLFQYFSKVEELNDTGYRWVGKAL